MKRFLVLAFLSWLPACVTAQGDAPISAIEETPCPEAAKAKSLYAKQAPNPKTAGALRLRECAALAGHVVAMSSLGRHLANTPRRAGDFEQGMDFLRRAAVAGDMSAQRYLAMNYETGRTEQGEAWIGRNAYLALFWDGVTRRDDPSYRFLHKTSTILKRFRAQLSEDARHSLDQQIEDWRPGIAEPPTYTFDILMTAVLRNRSTIAPAKRGVATEPIIGYGLKSKFPDAPLLGLMFSYNDRRDGVPEALLSEMSEKGSLLSLMLALRQIGAQDGREAEENALILQLLARLGLDIRYLQPRHEVVLAAFSKTGNLDALMLEIAAASRPERPILATIASMIACNGDRTESCAATADRLAPLITQPAMNFIVLVNAMDRCGAQPERNGCLLENGGMAALRDIIVSDLVDFGGRTT